MERRRRGAGSLAVLLLVASLVASVAAPAVAAAQSAADCRPGEPNVLALDFRGNHAFTDGDLSQIIATTTSSFVRRATHRFGQQRCLDRDELARDIARVKLYYRKRGYWKTEVDTVVVPRGGNNVGVVFNIVENAPIRLTTLRISGLEGVADRRALLGGLDTTTGGPYDEFRLEALADTIASRLLDNGYPRARIAVGHDVTFDSMTSAYYIDVNTGHLMRIGEVRVVVDSTHGRQKIRSRTVNKILGLRPGSVYRRRNVLSAQRNLYATDAYRHVEVGLDPDETIDDTLVVVRASLIEGDMRSMQTGAGWATIDCFRTQATYGDRNFLGGARRIDVTGRLSKIGVGRPTDWKGTREHLCKPATDSVSADRLNYYAGATYRQPTFFGLRARSVPSFTLYSERRGEFRQYERSTPIGLLASVAREQWPRVPITFGYQIERGRTSAKPAFFCGLFRICNQAELNTLANKFLALAVASAAISIDRTDVPLTPTHGGTARLELRHASRAIGSSTRLQFNKVVGEVSWFTPLSDRTVFAARVRGGTVLPRTHAPQGAGDDGRDFIPPQERFYAGGANTVRGFQQNELGPVVYVANPNMVAVTTNAGGDRVFTVADPLQLTKKGYTFVATGGTSLLVANAEVRFRDPFFPNLLQWTAFTDLGKVWERGKADVLPGKVQVTPGLGLSILSFLGPIGVTAGYNRYDRPAGLIYYNDVNSSDPTASNGTFCLNPTGSVTAFRQPDGSWKQNAADCASPNFTPVDRTSFFSHITLQVSIGQAF